MFQKSELKELWPFYFYKFMRGVFFLTTITLFIFYSEKGLTYFQASIAIAFSSLMQVVFELVTGSVADKFGRKRSVVISLFIDAAIIFGVAVSTQFWQFFVLLGLWGISTTLASGADQAWAVDSLIHERKEHLLDSYYAKSRSFFNAGMIVAGIISSSVLIFSTNQTLWFVRSGLTFFLAFVLVMFAKEKFVPAKAATTIKIAKKAITQFKTSRVLKFMGLASFFGFLAVYLAQSSAIQDFKLQGGVPLEAWGMILLVSTVLGIFTPHIGIKLSKNFKLKNYIAFAYLVLAVSYMLAIKAFNPFIIVALAIFYKIIDDLYVPVEDKLYNQHTPSKQRASIHSLRSMIGHAGVIIGITLAGVLTDTLGGAMTITIAGLFALPAVIAAFMAD